MWPDGRTSILLPEAGAIPKGPIEHQTGLLDAFSPLNLKDEENTAEVSDCP